jgi:hypothetical protein
MRPRPRPCTVLGLAALLAGAAACSRRNPRPAGAAAPRASGPPVRTRGALTIGMPREGGDGGVAETALAVGPAFAQLGDDHLEVALFNDQAAGVSCESLARMGSREPGTGWAVHFNNGTVPYDGRAGTIAAANVTINHPVGDVGYSNFLEGPVTVTEVTPRSIAGRFDVRNARGDRYVRGDFVAQRCDRRLQPVP